MKCTKCHKDINEGDTVYVTHEYEDDLDFPFCSYECLGRYFCNYEDRVSKEFLDFCSNYDGDEEEAIHEWIYG